MTPCQTWKKEFLIPYGESEDRSALLLRAGHCRAQEGKDECVLESLPQSASSPACYQLHRSLVLKPTLGASEKYSGASQLACREPRSLVLALREVGQIRGFLVLAGRVQQSLWCRSLPFPARLSSRQHACVFLLNTIFSTLGRLGRLNSPSEPKPWTGATEVIEIREGK